MGIETDFLECEQWTKTTIFLFSMKIGEGRMAWSPRPSLGTRSPYVWRIFTFQMVGKDKCHLQHVPSIYWVQ